MIYRNAYEHLKDYLGRLKLMLQRHLRNSSHRLTDQSELYSDECVSRSEALYLFGIVDDQSGENWLDQRSFPKEEEVLSRLHEHSVRMQVSLGETVREEHFNLPIEELRAGFGLSTLELNLLIAAAAPRISEDISRLYSFAWSDFMQRQPTAGFLARLVASSEEERLAALEALEPGQTLHDYRLIATHEHDRWKPSTPPVHRLVEVPDRVLRFVQGRSLDGEDFEGCQLHKKSVEIDHLHVDPIARQRLMAVLRNPTFRVGIYGPEGVGKRSLLCALSEQVGVHVLEVDLSQALMPPEHQGDRWGLINSFSEILREARLHRAYLLLRFDGGLDDHGIEKALLSRAVSLRKLLARYPGGIAVTSRESTSLIQSLFLDLPEIHIEIPPLEVQSKLWQQALKPHLQRPQAEKISEVLAQSYRLSPGNMFRAVEGTLRRSPTPRGTRRLPGKRLLSSSALIETIRSQNKHRLGWLAEPYSVELGLDDVVLSPEVLDTIKSVLIHARNTNKVYNQWGFNRYNPAGRGLNILFSGPPGTGKTLVAGVLARELGKILYRVDLSRIVDKYIGETEKNLAKIFDEATRAQAIILFDEADSLFAKRTSVKSSNDRYANLEVNFLLQRLEAFNGMSILTTNLSNSLDDAFQRRIQFKIVFPLPDPILRSQLWQRLLPSKAPREEGIDFEELGEAFELSGGHIKNAILRAAMRAAEEDSMITQEMLWNSAVGECREMGGLVTSTRKPRRS